MENIGFKLYMLFMVSWFIHLPSRIPVLAAIRFDLFLITILLVITFIHISQKTVTLKDKTDKCLTALIIYAVLSTPFVEWPGSVIKFGIPNFIKAVVFYYFTVTFVTSERRLKLIIGVFIACQSVRVLEPLYLHITTGYWGGKTFMSGDFLNRLSGGPHDFVNANGLAYIIVSVIPFYYYMGFIAHKYKVLALFMLPLMIYALILTSSRSGLLALCVIVMFILAKSKHKVILATVLVVAGIIFISQLDAEHIDRYKSIFDSSTKNAATSRARIDGIKEAFEIALKKPIFGHGLGTSREASWEEARSTVMAHNLYAEIAQELGFVGLAIFLVFMKSVIFNFFASHQQFKRNFGDKAFLIRMTDAMQTWLAMNLLFSLASYGLSGYAWYLFAGFSVVLRRLSCVKESEKVLLEC